MVLECARVDSAMLVDEGIHNASGESAATDTANFRHARGLFDDDVPRNKLVSEISG